MFSIYPDILWSNPLYLSKREFRSAFLRHRDNFKGRVLDLGCGLKPFRKFLKGEEYIGLDYTTHNKPSISAEALNLPFKDKSFDTILCSEVLEHIKEPSLAISECFRVLKPGGIFYLTVPMTWYLHHEPNDFYRFTKYGIIYLCQKGGFDILSVERIGGFMMYLCLRIGEFLNTVLAKYLFAPLGLFGVRMWPRRRLAVILLMPFQVFSLFMIFLFDRFSPRDARGWIVLSRRKKE